MVDYFKSLHASLVSVLYPDSRMSPPGFISAANFSKVCRYVTKARIESIFASISGRGIENRIAVPRMFAVPKALSDIVNGLGLTIGQQDARALRFVPKPEDTPAERADQLQTLVMRPAFHTCRALFTECCGIPSKYFGKQYYFSL
ncbi:unnamed protein product [Bemisia tabaci]|uniref:Uncharacterized protein n=1 Tax=Bemisia tabaci TaxID=7038 RepID=A0A9P0F3P6_BEMTA|nr:unnamed protein product [Bemisia tabaci]